VARVLICEPHGDIGDLLGIVVRRMGHEPVVFDGRIDDDHGFGAAVIELAMPGSMVLAERLHQDGVPLVFASILPAESAALDLHPVAYLVKPFALHNLERALEDALGPDQGASSALGYANRVLRKPPDERRLHVGEPAAVDS
jgi:hypothetical protein